MLEIIKNSTLTNNKRERDVTENGKSFLVPRSKVQASSRQESKGIGVQSPSVQSSQSKSPDHMPRVQLFRDAFLNIVIKSSMLFTATGFATMSKLQLHFFSLTS